MSVSTPPGLAPSLYYTAYESARWVYNFPKRVRYRATFDEIKTASSDRGIRLNLGRSASTPVSSGPVIGGQIKLIHLRERFSECLTDFNCIYIVSSALPPYAGDFVRWARSRGCRFVLNQNGVAYRSWCGDYYPWFNKPLRELLQLADFIVYQSDFCRRYADRYLAPSNVPSTILFNPVNVHDFSPPSEPLDLSRWELLAAGTNHHFYRVQASLDCLALLLARGVSARLTIAGGFKWPNGEQQVLNYMEEKNLLPHVRFLPPFTQTAAPAIYREAHVLIHPKYKDPCPTVPVEAMASGLPVVGSRSGGMPELIPPSAGILVDVPDDDDRDHAPPASGLADAVEQVMSRRESYSSSARAHALQTFDRDSWLKEHERIFQSVLA